MTMREHIAMLERENAELKRQLSTAEERARIAEGRVFLNDIMKVGNNPMLINPDSALVAYRRDAIRTTKREETL